MATPRERFLTKAQLSSPFMERLPTSHQPGDVVWLWINKNKYVEGIINGVTFQDGFMITYDVAIQVQDTDLYLVTYGIRGGITKPGAEYLGDDDGMVKAEETPYGNTGNMHH